jgi:hypothetical protein
MGSRFLGLALFGVSLAGLVYLVELVVRLAFSKLGHVFFISA